jgi:tetratricopeptide (TPR) repeat protein
LSTNNADALLWRAQAYERSGRLNEARSEYEGLQRQYPTMFHLYGYLGNVAIRQNDTNAAIRYTEAFLSNAPADTPEYSNMAERLRVLKGGKAP